MTFDELESFVAIATGGGFTHASRKQHRSQPAISRRIRQLEQSLGARVFERAGRGVRLTAAGQALLPHAEAALAALGDARRAVQAVAARAVGAHALRLAIVGTLADLYLVRALRTFRKRFGDASIELRTATSREVSALVRRGEADVGLRYFPDTDRKLESLPLGHERLVVVVPSAHRIRAKRVASLRAFEGEKWLGFPPDPRHPESSGEVLQRQLAAGGLAHASLTPVDSLTAQKRLVEAGFGVALLPRSSVREEVQRGTLRSIELSRLQAEQPVVAVQRRSGQRHPHARSFLDIFARCTPELRSTQARR